MLVVILLAELLFDSLISTIPTKKSVSYIYDPVKVVMNLTTNELSYTFF